MNFEGRTAIVTGGGHGIGRALAEALADRGARVVVADTHRERAAKIASRIGGLAVPCDVSDPDSIDALVSAAVKEFGPVDIAVSNAGINDLGPDLDSTVHQVRRIVDVNLLAHVWMAQAVLPMMLESGGGALIQTISSAALITGPSGMGYTMTKHGALGFAEWIALNYRDAGIKVVCLCPNAVNTGMLGRNEDEEETAGQADDGWRAVLGDVVEPEDCAASALDALDAGRFLALPHPRVGESFARKATDYDSWLSKTSKRLTAMRHAGSELHPPSPFHRR
jgi:NAD(P)-dependent dehydrogenase (short-subunit alcohol dehydrogenase family)